MPTVSPYHSHVRELVPKCYIQRVSSLSNPYVPVWITTRGKARRSTYSYPPARVFSWTQNKFQNHITWTIEVHIVFSPNSIRLYPHLFLTLFPRSESLPHIPCSFALRGELSSVPPPIFSFSCVGV